MPPATGPAMERLDADTDMWPPVTRRRKVANALFWGLCFLSLVAVVGADAVAGRWRLYRAVPHFQFSVLTTHTTGDDRRLGERDPGDTGRSPSASIIVSGTISVLTGLYLAEFAQGRHKGFLRGAYEVLAGIPSVVLGYVAYVTLVVGFLHMGQGLLPAVLVLSVIGIPYIAKSTETSLAQVPSSYREGAKALGLSAGGRSRKIVLKSALPGIVTGLLVAIAITVGETAPLIFVGGWSDFNPTGRAHPRASGLPHLPHLVLLPGRSRVQWTCPTTRPLRCLMFVLVLILLGLLIVTVSRRHAE